MPTRREILNWSSALAIAAHANPGFSRTAWPRLDGRVVTPGDDDYERLRGTSSRNPRFDRRPRVIAECASTDDVRRSLEFARANGLAVAVRSGGHDVLGASSGDGIVVDLERLSSVEWVPGHGVRVGAGVRAGRVNGFVAGRERVVALGCNPSVGISGLTLGGGIGWYAGRFGAACDQVRAARLVTVDGDVVDVSAGSNAELFWALRGGGGNFGVVTNWEFESRPMPTVTVGAYVYSARQTAEFLACYRDLNNLAPGALTVEVVALGHVEPIMTAFLVFTGERAAARAALEPLRRLGTPLAEQLHTVPVADMERLDPSVQRYFEWTDIAVPGEARQPGSYWQGVTLDSLTDGAIESIREAIESAPPGWSLGLGHVMRGALVDVPMSSTAMPRPAGQVTVHFDGGWSYASLGRPLMAWVDASIRALDPHRAERQYINYLSDDDPGAVRSAYGDRYERLVAVKRRFDPTNVLRGNRNILPA